jgi:hypothetical protein
MAMTETTASREGLTLITDVGPTGVTRHQVEEYYARRHHDQSLVGYYRTVRQQRSA